MLKVDFGRQLLTDALQPAIDRFRLERNVGFLRVDDTVPAPGGIADIRCQSHDGFAPSALEGLLRQIQAPTEPELVERLGWDVFSLDGCAYAYPIAFLPTAFLYNPALVDRAPASFERVVALDESLRKRKGARAVAWDYADALASWPLLGAGGASVFGRDAEGYYDLLRTGLTAPSVIKGARFIESLFDAGLLSPGTSGADAEAAFIGGKAAFFIAGPDNWAALHRSGLDWRAAPFPTLDGRKPMPLLRLWGCSVAAAGQHELAVDFIENHLMRPAALADLFAANPGLLAVHPEVRADQMRGPRGQAAWNAVTVSRPVPAIPETMLFWSVLSKALQHIGEGTSAAAALDEAAADFRTAVLSENPPEQDKMPGQHRVH